MSLRMACGLDADILEPAGTPRGTVICLHGVGQSGSLFRDLLARLGLIEKGMRCVLPNAPDLYRSSFKAATPARAWFNQTLTSLSSLDVAQMNDTSVRLGRLIEQEVSLAGAGRVLLLGFSQGAAMALVAGLRAPQRLAGLALYAPYWIRSARLSTTRSPHNTDMPVWIGHGQSDMVIPLRDGIWVQRALSTLGYRVNWHAYPNGHECFENADEDLSAFIDDVLAPQVTA